jgi:translation initiation factor IF-3
VGFRRRRWRDLRPEEDKIRVNRNIRVPEVRVVNEDGQQLGIMSTDAALDIANRVGLDLVEIAANARPPVCKIMDYGRYKYELKKKASHAKKSQHQTHVKEVKFRPRISEHDFDFKIKRARKFLMDGDKVKCTVMFRGREMQHTHLGRALMERVTEALADLSNVEHRPQMEGRILSSTVAPNRAQIEKAKAQAARAAAEAKAADEETEATPDAAEAGTDQAGGGLEEAEPKGADDDGVETSAAEDDDETPAEDRVATPPASESARNPADG